MSPSYCLPLQSDLSDPFASSFYMDYIPLGALHVRADVLRILFFQRAFVISHVLLRSYVQSGLACCVHGERDPGEWRFLWLRVEVGFGAS